MRAWVAVQRDGACLIQTLVPEAKGSRYLASQTAGQWRGWRRAELGLIRTAVEFDDPLVNRRVKRDQIAAKKPANGLDVMKRFGGRARPKAEACQSARWPLGQR